MNTEPVPGGMDRIDIKAALERRGWSLRRLSMAHDYSPHAAKIALQRPYPLMEWIIAEALEKLPWEVWPDRYPNSPVPRPESRDKARHHKNEINLNAGYTV